MRKRKHVVSFHLSAKELRHLEIQVALSGLNREEFMRTLIMGAELRARPCEHHADLLRKISGDSCWGRMRAYSRRLWKRWKWKMQLTEKSSHLI